jgi:hypothetical protein
MCFYIRALGVALPIMDRNTTEFYFELRPKLINFIQGTSRTLICDKSVKTQNLAIFELLV